MGSVLGGKKTTVPASGFYALPQSFQNAYNSILGNVESGISGINANMFKPMAQTGDESRALDMFRQGFTPTADSLRSDISMLTNPYNEFVIDDINRQAGGDYSVLKQALNQAGQFGSNRQMLGANDIEQTRLGTIGKFRQDQYNNIINQIFNNLIPQRQNDAQGLLGVGDFQRELDSREKMAPLQALSAQTGLIGSIPTEFGNFGTQQQTIKTGGGLGGFLNTLGQGAQLASAGMALFSDPRLKENVIPVGERNGYPIYEFNYIGDDKVYIGVMADEVERLHPEAVTEIDGYKAVDYSKLGFEMELKHGIV